MTTLALYKIVATQKQKDSSSLLLVVHPSMTRSQKVQFLERKLVISSMNAGALTLPTTKVTLKMVTVLTNLKPVWAVRLQTITSLSLQFLHQ
ncbi:hypothetical protein D3C87_1851830 [compost metagenome]